jgi:hypothetical protein
LWTASGLSKERKFTLTLRDPQEFNSMLVDPELSLAVS